MNAKATSILASAQALTGSYVVSDEKPYIEALFEGGAYLTVLYTTGAAETSNSIEFKIEFSDDSSNWIQEQKYTESGGTVTHTAIEHTLAGASAATTYKTDWAFPAWAKYFRVFFKETGVAANAGTVTAYVTLTEELSPRYANL